MVKDSELNGWVLYWAFRSIKSPFDFRAICFKNSLLMDVPLEITVSNGNILGNLPLKELPSVNINT